MLRVFGAILLVAVPAAFLVMGAPLWDRIRALARWDAKITFPDAGAARGTPWAERMFGIPGVVSLFGMRDFLTVTKAPAADWNVIVPKAVAILAAADLAAGR